MHAWCTHTNTRLTTNSEGLFGLSHTNTWRIRPCFQHPPQGMTSYCVKDKSRYYGFSCQFFWSRINRIVLVSHASYGFPNRISLMQRRRVNLRFLVLVSHASKGFSILCELDFSQTLPQVNNINTHGKHTYVRAHMAAIMKFSTFFLEQCFPSKIQKINLNGDPFCEARVGEKLWNPCEHPLVVEVFYTNVFRGFWFFRG